MKTDKKCEMKGLEDTSRLSNYNTWMLNMVEPLIKGDILEIGSGVGRISEHLVRRHDNVTLSDCSEEYLAILRDKFPYNLVLELDLTDDSVIKRYHDGFDTIICFNVIEHIEKDSIAVKNLNKLLKKGGTLIIAVPAYNWLFNTLDKNIYHYRRYNKKMLRNVLEQNNFLIANLSYFNASGIPGWFVAGTILRRKTVPEGSLKLYDTLLPIFKWFEKYIFRGRLGINVLAIAIKRGRK